MKFQETKGMTLSFTRATAIGILFFAVIFFLLNSLPLFIAGFVRVHNAIEVSDANRENIGYLLDLNSEHYEDMPDIATAVKAEYLVLMHKDEVTITYDDETTFRFFIKDAYENPLTQYIKENGYVVYFKSSEFAVDAVKVGIPLLICIISTVFLIMSEPKPTKRKRT